MYPLTVGGGNAPPRKVFKPGEKDMSWFYYANEQRIGPVEAEEIRGRVERGELGPDDLVWTEGMAEWATLEAPLPQPAKVGVQVGKLAVVEAVEQAFRHQ